MNDIIKAIQERRSIRSYKEDKVSMSDIEKIIDAGMYGPCGLSMKNRHFTGIVGEKPLNTVNEAIRQSLLNMQIDENTVPYMIKLKEMAGKEDANFLYNAPALIIVSINNDDVFGSANSSVSLQNMMLAARSLDLDTCWLNQLTRLDKVSEIITLKKELGIPENNVIHGSLAVGYGNMEPGKERGAIKKSSFSILD